MDVQESTNEKVKVYDASSDKKVAHVEDQRTNAIGNFFQKAPCNFRYASLFN